MSLLPETSGVVVECKDVSVIFPDADLRRPERSSWVVRGGSRTLLLGPSGCGKSTLALAIAGLLPRFVPARLEGAVHVGGVSVADQSPVEISSRVSIVFQDPDAQLFTESVFDEVCFALENRLLPADEIERRAYRALDALGLREVALCHPARLSGGMRQRVAIACALASDPEVLVLDEPSAHLDPAARAELYRVLNEMPSDSGRAVIIIDHNVDDAVLFVDRVVALDHSGAVLVEGDVEDVFAHHSAVLDQAGVWLPTGVILHSLLAQRGLSPGLPSCPPLHVNGIAELLMAVGEVGVDAGLIEQATERARRDAREPLIEVSNVTVQRRGPRGVRHTVLREVNVSVAEGSFTAIVGVNGAGKSTLLHTMAGILRVRKGAVTVAGVRVRRQGRSPIGLVFQNPEHQFVEATVREELAAAADHTLDPEEQNRRVGELLERFGLQAASARHPSQLSGGQKRRLSVGTALMSGHRIIAFDEPTFGQDAQRAAEMVALLKDLNAAGATIIVVTHDLQLVADHATDVIVMRDGEVFAEGATGVTLSSAVIDAAGLRLPTLAAAARMLDSDNPLSQVRRFADLDTAEVQEQAACAL